MPQSISLDSISSQSVLMRSNPGFSGSGCLVWNAEKMKFELVGVCIAVIHVPSYSNWTPVGLGINNIIPTDYSSREEYVLALEKCLPFLSMNCEGERIYIVNPLNPKLQSLNLGLDPSTLEDTIIMYIKDNKISPIEKIGVIDLYPEKYQTFEEYKKEMSKSFNETRIGYLHDDYDMEHNIFLHPFSVRFLEKFKEVYKEGTILKGVYKI